MSNDLLLLNPQAFEIDAGIRVQKLGDLRWYRGLDELEWYNEDE